MQFCNLGEILWYGKFFWYEYIMELASWMLPCKILIFSYIDVCHEFPISMEWLNCKPILIFSQMLWILSIRLIELETNMRMYCSRWQFDYGLQNSREKNSLNLRILLHKILAEISIYSPKLAPNFKGVIARNKSGLLKINFACNLIMKYMYIYILYWLLIKMLAALSYQ